MEIVTCSRDMSALIERANSTFKREYLVFREADYSDDKLCNLQWVSATSYYWALTKVEALGTVGERYVLMSKQDYAARAVYTAPR